jgi:hypothetical protein
MPRFTILTHDHPFPHWDFLLERGEALQTWRLLTVPDSPGEITAEPLPDHRLMYLDYEGPVSNGRGVVSRWDTGDYNIVQETTERLEVELTGERLTGRFILERAVGSPVWRFYSASE